MSLNLSITFPKTLKPSEVIFSENVGQIDLQLKIKTFAFGMFLGLITTRLSQGPINQSFNVQWGMRASLGALLGGSLTTILENFALNVRNKLSRKQELFQTTSIHKTVSVNQLVASLGMPLMRKGNSNQDGVTQAFEKLMAYDWFQDLIKQAYPNLKDRLATIDYFVNKVNLGTCSGQTISLMHFARTNSLASSKILLSHLFERSNWSKVCFYQTLAYFTDTNVESWYREVLNKLLDFSPPLLNLSHEIQFTQALSQQDAERVFIQDLIPLISPLLEKKMVVFGFFRIDGESQTNHCIFLQCSHLFRFYDSGENKNAAFYEFSSLESLLLNLGKHCITYRDDIHQSDLKISVHIFYGEESNQSK